MVFCSQDEHIRFGFLPLHTAVYLTFSSTGRGALRTLQYCEFFQEYYYNSTHQKGKLLSRGVIQHSAVYPSGYAPK